MHPSDRRFIKGGCAGDDEQGETLPLDGNMIEQGDADELRSLLYRRGPECISYFVAVAHVVIYTFLEHLVSAQHNTQNV